MLQIMDYKKKRDKQLGKPFTSCRAVLDRLILFNLLKRLEENFCYRCEKEIKSVNEFSVEHKISWVDSDNPKELFWSMDNIAFSHLSCNCRAGFLGKVPSKEHRRKISLANKGRKLTKKQYDEMVERNKRICTTPKFKLAVSNAMKK